MQLSEKIKSFRADRPDEWTMDSFIEEATKIEKENAALREHISRISDAQKDNDWQLMGVSIREAAEDL